MPPKCRVHHFQGVGASGPSCREPQGHSSQAVPPCRKSSTCLAWCPRTKGSRRSSWDKKLDLRLCMHTLMYACRHIHTHSCVCTDMHVCLRLLARLPCKLGCSHMHVHKQTHACTLTLSRALVLSWALSPVFLWVWTMLLVVAPELDPASSLHPQAEVQ